MRTVSLADSLFPHATTVGNGGLNIRPTTISFDRTEQPHTIKIFTDKNLDDAKADTTPIKIAWLIESPDLFDDVYEKIVSSEYLNSFDYILTHNKKLLEKNEKFMFNPFGGTWVPFDDWKIYDKTKNVSIIASAKSDLVGHRLRHSVIELYQNVIDDVLGGGYIPFEEKRDGLKDYRYSIVIENCKEDYWFTEKLIDCFATGTIPIYWGCPSIGDFFNTDGMIMFDTLADLEGILANISEESYNTKTKVIQENFETARRYAVTEDSVYNNIINIEAKLVERSQKHD